MYILKSLLSKIKNKLLKIILHCNLFNKSILKLLIDFIIKIYSEKINNIFILENYK